MKKFNFKAIFIIMMVLVLAFALVACGDKGDDVTPPGPDIGGGGGNGGGGGSEGSYTPADYFTNLWDLSANIGDEEIKDGDNIAIHMAFELAVNLANGAGQVKHSVDFGFGVDFVLDRNAADDGVDGVNNATAIRVQVYDPSGENFVTVYFFMNDPSAIYFDYAGQNLKVEFDYHNDTFLDNFNNLIFNEQLFGNKTINALLAEFTADMGEDWSLDTLIDTVIGMTGVDLQGMLGNYEDTIKMIIGTGLFNDQGKLNIKEILTSDIAGTLFVNTSSSTSNGVTTNKTEVDSDILGLVGGLMGDMGSILDGLKLGLEYQYASDALNYFTIYADFTKITAKDVNGTTVHPMVAISIKDFEITKAGNNEIVKAGSTYSSDLYFDNSLSLSVDNVVLHLSELNAEIPDLTFENTVVTFGVAGRVDLKNLEDNKTIVNVYLAVDDVHVLDLSLTDGVIALQLNQEAKLGEVAIVDTLVRVGGPYLKAMMDKYVAGVEAGTTPANALLDLLVNAVSTGVFNEDWTALDEGFNGVALTGVEIVPMFQQAIDTAIEFITSAMAPPVGAESAAAISDSVVKKVVDTIKYIIPLINTKDGKLTIGGEDLMKTVVKIYRQFDKPLYDATTKNETANGIAHFVNLIIAADTSDMLSKVVKVLDIGANTSNVGFLTAIFTDLEGYVTIDFGAHGFSFDIDLVVNETVKVGVGISSTATNDVELVDVTALYKADPTGFVVFTLDELMSPAA